MNFNFWQFVDELMAEMTRGDKWKITKGTEHWEAHPPRRWGFHPYTFPSFQEAINHVAGDTYELVA